MSWARHGRPPCWAGILLIVTLVLGIGGYRLRQAAQSEEVQVRATIRSFMLARLTRDDAKVRRFLTVRMHGEYVNQSAATLIGEADPHYQRYHILGVERHGDGTWIGQVRIDQNKAGFLPAGWFVETITLVPVDGILRVDKVTRGDHHEPGGKRR